MAKTILVVEDDPSLRTFAVRVLRRGGHTVIEAPDAEQAAALVSERGEGVDLLATDFHLPGMNGDRLAAQLREGDPRLKVLIVSGTWPPYDSRFPVLTKPYSPQELLDKVEEVLEGR